MLRGVGKLKQGLSNRKNSETMKDQTYFREISAKPVMKVPPSPSLCLFSLSSYTIVQKSGNSIFPKDPPIRIFGGMVGGGGVGCPTVQSFPHGTSGKKERGGGERISAPTNPTSRFPSRDAAFAHRRLERGKRRRRGGDGGLGGKKLRQIILTFAVFFGGFLCGTE